MKLSHAAIIGGAVVVATKVIDKTDWANKKRTDAVAKDANFKGDPMMVWLVEVGLGAILVTATAHFLKASPATSVIPKVA